MEKNRDKRLRFSIRKFNVGVASVAVAAFFMIGASAVSADSVTPVTATAVVASSQDSPAEDSGASEEVAEPAETPAEVAPAAQESAAPVAASAETVASEEAPATEEAVSQPEAPAPATVNLKTTAIIYTVQYVDKATGKVVHRLPKSAQVTSSEELPSVDVTEYSTDVPAGFLLAADQSQVTTQTITKKAKNVITFYVEEDLDPTAGTSPEAQEGSSGLRSTFELNTTQVAVPDAWYKSLSPLQLDDAARATIAQAIRDANPHLDAADRVIVRPAGDAVVIFSNSSLRPGSTFSLAVGTNYVDYRLTGEIYNFLQKDTVLAPQRVEVEDMANLTEANLKAIEDNFRAANAHHLVEADKVEVSPTGRLTVTKAATDSRLETIIIFDPSEVLLERELKKYHWLDFSDPKATVRDKNGQPLVEETAYDDTTRAPFTYKKLEVGTVYEREIYPGYTVRAEVTALKPYLPGDAALYGENADKNVYHKSNVDQYVGGTQPGQEGYERRDRAGDIADVVIRAQDPNWSNLRNSGASTGTNFTSIGSLHQGANVGITFKVSAIINGNEYPVNVIMADSEDGSRPEIVYFKTDGTPWEISRTVQMRDGLQVGAPTTVQDLLDSYGSAAQKERRQYAENGFDPEQWVNKGADGNVTTGEGTQLFGGVPTLVGQYAVPLVISRNVTEVSGYVNSFGRQFFQLAFVVEDLGDAPDTYGDAIHNISNHVYAANGALETFNQPYLGSVEADPETLALPGRQNETATGDDSFNPTKTADEGEEQLTGGIYDLVKAGAGSTFELIANLGDGNEQAFVKGWIDFNQNGTFDADEASDLVKVTENGTVKLTYGQKVPETAIGDFTSRIRIALAESDVTNPTGFARSGEVEDFVISYGNVTVEHKTVDGTVLKASTPVFEASEEVKTPYKTEALTGDQLVIDGKTYRLVRLAGEEDVTNKVVDNVSAPADGILGQHPKEDYTLKADGTVEKAPQHVVYLYEEVKGQVTVEHKTVDGKVLKATANVFTEPQSLGTTYTTAPETFEGYRLTVQEIDPASAPKTGDVTEQTKHVIYLYEPIPVEVKGNVTVEHVTDQGEVLKASTPVFAENQAIGTDYTTSKLTTDGKPEGTFVTEDGRVFKFTKMDEKSDPAAGDVTEAPQHVKYVYTEVKGNVTVDYVDTNGKKLQQTYTDKESAPLNQTYNTAETTTEKPGLIKVGNKTYALAPANTYPVGTVGENNNLTTSTNPELGTAAVEGNVVEGTTKITYVYEEVTGSVIVKYVDDKGQTIPGVPNQTDTPVGTPVETPYNTTDQGMKPEKVTSSDNKVYYFKEVAADSVNKESGQVKEGETVITYVYEQAGSVVVNYKIEGSPEINVIKDQQIDQDNTKPGTQYTTADQNMKPELITHGNKTYRLVPELTENKANESGQVEAGVTKEITYVYREVKGDVTVEHVTDTGEVLKATAPVFTESQSIGTDYTTSKLTTEGQEEGTFVTEDGRVFKFTKMGDQSAPAAGDVTEEAQHVKYVYTEVKGNVTVEHVTDTGEVLKATAPVFTADQSIGTDYTTSKLTTEGQEEGTFVTEDGRVFKFTKMDDQSAPAAGDVTEATQHVKYVYTEVKGNVTVEHVTDTGEVLKATAPVFTEEQSVGTDYTTSKLTTDGKPEGTVVTEDGRVFKFTKMDDQSAPAAGDVTEEAQHVKYIYTEVKGDVTVEHVSDKGEVLIPTADVQKGASIGTDYTTENLPTITTADGRVFTYKEVAADSAPVAGDVTETPQHVKYVYTEVLGKVTVDYVDTEGNTLQPTYTDKASASINSDYNTAETTTEKPGVIKVGKKTYVIAPADDYTVGKVGADGNLTETETGFGTDSVAGKVAEKTKQITYVYKEITNNVTVEHVTDSGEILKATVPVFTEEQSVGTDYTTSKLTTDGKSEGTFVTEDGRVFKFTKLDEQSAPVAGDVTEEAQHVKYIYTEVKGDVTVEHVSDKGEVLIAEEPVKTQESVGTDYTTANKDRITTPDGRVFTYKEVAADSAPVEGKVTEENQKVVYVYEEVKGNVLVNYINEAGEVIKTQVEDTPASSVDTEYKTTDNKPTEITTENGKVYEFIKVDETSAPEAGKVVEGTTEVTYVYREVKGDVVVSYKSTDGKEIKTPVVDTPESSVKTPYDTKDNKPTLIEFEGKTYEIVPTLTEGNEDGSVVRGTTKVTYVYREVPKATPKGNVLVNYINEAGEVIKTQVEDTPASPVDTEYKTTDNKPTEITTENGKVYEFIKVDEISAPEAGKVVEGTTEVTYVYREVKGDVVVSYKSTDGKEIKTPVVDTPESSVKTPYNTEDNKPTLIEFEGKTYEIVPTLTEGKEDGSVVRGTTKVTYVYREVPKATPKGNVLVNYINEAGEVIKTQVEDTPASPVDTEYKTTDNKPTEITTENGKVYEFIKVDETSAPEAGKVVEGTTEVTYVYREVKGDVVVSYKSTDGKEIKTPVVDTPESSVKTPYDTKDNKPTLIEFEGKTYEIVPTLTEGKEDGSVVRGTTKVTYVYREVPKATPKGNVLVNYINEAGEVIKTQVEDTPASPVDTEYKTTDNKPTEITTENGKVYEFIKVDEKSAPEAGKVVEGTTEVTYVYREVKGDVVVSYKSTDGKEIKTPVVDTPESSVGTTYTTTDNKPSTITTPDGKTYKIVPNYTDGKEQGTIVPGTTKVTYVYEEVKGDVVVHYVNEEGQTIKTDVLDTPKTSTGTDYTTTDNKPAVIITEDDTRYVLVPAKTQGSEDGKVVEGTTHVTYVYAKAANWIPLIPGLVNPPKVPYPFDPTNPEKPVDPLKPIVPGGDVPVIPYIPGYEPEIPLVPVDPEDPTKGYIPPVPEVPGVDTPIPYVPVTPPVAEKGDVVVTYKSTDGKEIKTPVVDTPESPVGTTYTTTDNKPSTITTPDGKTYKIVPNLTTGKETGTIVPGTTTVTYVYEEVKGDVVVHYVNEEGETIKADVVDTPSTSTGTEYATTDNKPAVIVTEDGTRYVLVPAKTQGSEEGQVVEGTTHVTYVYAKAANWIPLIPGEQNPPKVPYPFDPTNPEKPVDPGQPIVPGGDVPVIPYVPGYEPEIPLVPVDPNDPTKGYIPPVPEVPGVDTPIPYIPVPPTTPEQPEEPVTPTPEKPTQPVEPVTPRPVTPATPATPAKATLPNTGDASSAIGLVGSGLMLVAASMLIRRRRKED